MRGQAALRPFDTRGPDAARQHRQRRQKSPVSYLIIPATITLRASENGARASGTPFISFYTPQEMLALAREAGFKDAQHVSGSSLAGRYFADGPTAFARQAERIYWWPPSDGADSEYRVNVDRERKG